MKKRYTEEQVIEQLKEQTSAWGAARRFAEMAGVKPPFITQVLQGVTPVSDKIAEALGLRKEIIFVPIKDVVE